MPNGKLNKRNGSNQEDYSNRNLLKSESKIRRNKATLKVVKRFPNAASLSPSKMVRRAVGQNLHTDKKQVKLNLKAKNYINTLLVKKNILLLNEWENKFSKLGLDEEHIFRLKKEFAIRINRLKNNQNKYK